jgi:hypothetical protein
VVTPRVERYVRQRFEEAEAELVLSALRDWRIPYEAKPPGERLIAAVVLVADGSLGGVDDAFQLAEQDWRDLLVAAGLQHDDWRMVLDSRLGAAAD